MLLAICVLPCDTLSCERAERLGLPPSLYSGVPVPADDLFGVPVDVGHSRADGMAGGQPSPGADIPVPSRLRGLEGWAGSALAVGDARPWVVVRVQSSMQENSPPAQLPFPSERVTGCLVRTSSTFVTFLLMQSPGLLFPRELSSSSGVKPCRFATGFGGAGIFLELC